MSTVAMSLTKRDKGIAGQPNRLASVDPDSPAEERAAAGSEDPDDHVVPAGLLNCSSRQEQGSFLEVAQLSGRSARIRFPPGATLKCLEPTIARELGLVAGTQLPPLRYLQGNVELQEMARAEDLAAHVTIQVVVCTEEVARRVQEALARIRAAAASALASNRSREKKAQADAARTIRGEAKDIMDLLAACGRANLRSQFADSRGGSKAFLGILVEADASAQRDELDPDELLPAVRQILGLANSVIWAFEAEALRYQRLRTACDQRQPCKIRLRPNPVLVDAGLREHIHQDVDGTGEGSLEDQDCAEDVVATLQKVIDVTSEIRVGIQFGDAEDVGEPSETFSVTEMAPGTSRFGRPCSDCLVSAGIEATAVTALLPVDEGDGFIVRRQQICEESARSWRDNLARECHQGHALTASPPSYICDFCASPVNGQGLGCRTCGMDWCNSCICQLCNGDDVQPFWDGEVLRRCLEAAHLEDAAGYLRALCMEKAVYGDGHHRHVTYVIRTLLSLSKIFEKKGELEAAESHLKVALSMKRAMRGEVLEEEFHREVAITQAELGRLCRQKGDLQSAKSHLDAALSMQRAVYGEGPQRDVAVTLQELGRVCKEKGDLESAKIHLDAALSMQRVVYGRGPHRDVAITLQELGRLHEEKGDLQSAESHFDAALSMHGSHHDIAMTLRDLGRLCKKKGDLPSAERQLSFALRVQTRTAVPHQKTAITLQELGRVCEDKGDFQSAENYFDSALSMQRAVYGQGPHGEVAVTLQELGRVCKEMGDMESAKSHLDSALSMQRAVYGQGPHREVAITLQELGRVCKEMGDMESAESHFDAALSMQRAVRGEGPRRHTCSSEPKQRNKHN